MILFDTTVLVYAVGTEHPLRDPCQALLRAVATGELRASTTVEVIQEFAHLRARRRPRTDAAIHAADYVDLLSPLVLVDEAGLRGGLRLFSDHGDVGAFDAVLAAAAGAVALGGSGTVVSADRRFAQLPDLTHVFPDADGVAALLA